MFYHFNQKRSKIKVHEVLIVCQNKQKSDVAEHSTQCYTDNIQLTLITKVALCNVLGFFLNFDLKVLFDDAVFVLLCSQSKHKHIDLSIQSLKALANCCSLHQELCSVPLIC